MRPDKTPNIKLPQGFELKWNDVTSHWQMVPVKGYSSTYLKKDHFVPKKEKSGELFESEDYTKSKSKNANMHKAKKDKNDEFYTRLSDIAEELRHYKKFFEGKVVYCPCDKAYNVGRSNFFTYLASVYEDWGLKGLIATQYNPNPGEHGIVWKFYGDANNNGCVDESEISTDFLYGNGSFDSKECKDIMKECDIVVTNPPFSLFRDFVEQIMDMEKKFLIIGNKNAITYKEIFKYIKKNELWLGYSSPKDFIQPDGDEAKSMQGLTRWFTNLPHTRRAEELYLSGTYREGSDKYPHYDNYDAIEVGKVENIPSNYDGVMGVPITFLDKYCPTQFEVMGLMSGAKGDLLVNGNDGKPKFTINDKETYARILIRRKAEVTA